MLLFCFYLWGRRQWVTAALLPAAENSYFTSGQTQTIPAPPRQSWPSLAWPCRACHARPRRALPAPPRRAVPRHALPRLRCRIVPHHATPAPAPPNQSVPASPHLPRPGLLCVALPCLHRHAEPAMPYQALPCHAVPCPSTRAHAIFFRTFFIASKMLASSRRARYFSRNAASSSSASSRSCCRCLTFESTPTVRV